MKKLMIIILMVVISMMSLAKVLKVGVTPVPHTDFLEYLREDFKEKGIEIKIIEFNDYVTPNMALAGGEIDINFFQHYPYLKKFSEDRKLNLVSLGKIHIAPLGLYSKKIKSIENLAKGSTVALPNDPSNLGRALILLAKNNIIKLKNQNNWYSTEFDVIENPKKIKFKLIDAAQLPRILDDVDAAIITGNFAIQSGLSITNNSLISEGKNSEYANIVVVRKGDENKEEIKNFFKILQSQKLKDFIEKKYKGNVLAVY